MKLNDICEVYSGYAFKNFNDNKGYPVIKIGNIQADGKLDLSNCSFTNDRFNEKYMSKKDDLYVALSGATTGKVGSMDSDDKYVINQRVGVVRAKSNDTPMAFVKYFLLSKTEKILQDAAGCAQPNISPKQLSDYDFPKLSNKEMLDRANALKNISMMIDKQKEKISLLDELVKARFVEMFGDINETSKWQRKQWDDVLRIQNGKDYKHILVEDGGYPVYGTGGEMARASEYLCPENTIIVGRKGTINNPLLVKEKFWNVDTAFGVIPGNELHYQYLYNFCRMFDFEKLNKAAVLPSTTKGDLLKIEMNIPPIELQNEFAQFVEQIDKSKFICQKKIDYYQELLDKKMNEYFGE